MAYNIVINADFVTTYQLQSAKRVRIAQSVIDSLGWKEGDQIFELVDTNKKIVILIKKNDFEKLLKEGSIKMI